MNDEIQLTFANCKNCGAFVLDSDYQAFALCTQCVGDDCEINQEPKE